MDIESIIMELFDLILAHGFFHHIDDKLLDKYLKYFQSYFPQNGYLLSIDPCYVRNQNFISKFLVSEDRGNYVRTEKEYSNLLKMHFKEVKSIIRDDLLVVPYHSCIISCTGIRSIA